MKRVAKPVFFILAILILVLSYFATFGLHTQYGDIDTTVIKGIGDIRWGIDIRGGVEATFKPADGVDATDEEIEAAKAIMLTLQATELLLDSLGKRMKQSLTLSLLLKKFLLLQN